MADRPISIAGYYSRVGDKFQLDTVSINIEQITTLGEQWPIAKRTDIDYRVRQETQVGTWRVAKLVGHSNPRLIVNKITLVISIYYRRRRRNYQRPRDVDGW